LADEPVSRIVQIALQANKLFVLNRRNLSAMSIPSTWKVLWTRFGHDFEESTAHEEETQTEAQVFLQSGPDKPQKR
jgi:hypothetical protein